MGFLARLMSHGFAIALVLLLAIGFIYRGELFPEWELPDFLAFDSAKDTGEDESAGKIEPAPVKDDSAREKAPSGAEDIARVEEQAVQGADIPPAIPVVADVTEREAAAIAQEIPADAATDVDAGEVAGGEPADAATQADTGAVAGDGPADAVTDIDTGTITEDKPAEVVADEPVSAAVTQVPAPVITEAVEAPYQENTASIDMPEVVATDAAPVTGIVESSVQQAATPMDPAETPETPETPETADDRGDAGQLAATATGGALVAEAERMDSAGVIPDADKTPESEQDGLATGVTHATAAAEPAEAPAYVIDELPAAADSGPEGDTAPGQEAAPVLSSGELLALAREAYWMRDYLAAEDYYRQLIMADPDNPDGYGELANLYFSQGMWEAAASSYYEAGSHLVARGMLAKARELVDVIRGLNGPQADALEHEIAMAGATTN